MIKEQVIAAFKEEFHFIHEKFEIMDLLANKSPMDYDVIDAIRLPTEDYNIVWHPGVYVFIGNNVVYRIGVSMKNSRARVMQHLVACTGNSEYNIWHIANYNDGAILLFNVRDVNNRHWLLALEVFLETKFKPVIPALRHG